MKREEVVSKLKNLIEQQDQIEISSADQQLDIDSYTMMLVISYIREEMEIQLDMEDLDFDAFTSLNTLSELVDSQPAVH